MYVCVCTCACVCSCVFMCVCVSMYTAFHLSLDPNTFLPNLKLSIFFFFLKLTFESNLCCLCVYGGGAIYRRSHSPEKNDSLLPTHPRLDVGLGSSSLTHAGLLIAFILCWSYASSNYNYVKDFFIQISCNIFLKFFFKFRDWVPCNLGWL